jgi:hypothetical protein
LDDLADISLTSPRKLMGAKLLISLSRRKPNRARLSPLVKISTI